MNFWELSHEQSRHCVDARQVFETCRQAASQTWNGRNGRYTAWLSWGKGRNGRQSYGYRLPRRDLSMSQTKRLKSLPSRWRAL